MLVLFIACANVASLLLARAESRHREFAVRPALGAGRWHLLRRFMSEGLVLSLAGAAIGLALGVFGVRGLIAAFPDSLPRSADVTLDLRVLLFTLIVAVGSATVFGLAPLLHLAPSATAAALKEGGQRSTGGTRNRIRRSLVAAEVALAVALVIGAGLLLRTVMNLTRVDSGFSAGARDVRYQPSTVKCQSGAQIASFYGRLMGDLRRLPGVTVVAAMSGYPASRRERERHAHRRLRAGAQRSGQQRECTRPSHGLMDTMGVPVVDGRAFLPTDAIGAPVVLINETMARTF